MPSVRSGSASDLHRSPPSGALQARVRASAAARTHAPAPNNHGSLLSKSGVEFALCQSWAGGLQLMGQAGTADELVALVHYKLPHSQLILRGASLLR